LESHSLSQRFFRTYVAVYYEALAEYICRRTREGAFRHVDPLLSARGFLGMVVYHFLVQELFGGQKYQKFDPEMVAASLAGIWLNGMQTRTNKFERTTDIIYTQEKIKPRKLKRSSSNFVASLLQHGLGSILKRRAGGNPPERGPR
jgi:hypothetical protein